MTVDDFAGVTRRVIEREGIDHFLPTICFPDDREIVVVEGLEGIVPVEVVRAWAEARACSAESYLLAFRLASRQFQIDAVDGPPTHRRRSSRVFELPLVSSDG